MFYLFVSNIGRNVSWIRHATSIEVNAENRHIDRVKSGYTDNTGENISLDNPYWGELSALYWIWKNLVFNDDDIIGFAHYNKKLDISKHAIERLLKHGRYDWITRDPVTMVAHDYPEDIKVLEEVLEKSFPDYFEYWKQLYNHDGSSRDNGKTCVNCEMFFTTGNELERYCSFLFGVLFPVRHVIGNVERPDYHKRYCAFLGERLLSVYLLKNHCRVRNVYIASHQPPFIALLRKTSRLIGLNPEGSLVHRVKTYLRIKGRVSSYLR